MSEKENNSDEDIGRPGPWGEGRYQKKGQRTDQSVRTPPGTTPGDKPPVSTPVTRKDYESPPPGGDGG